MSRKPRLALDGVRLAGATPADGTGRGTLSFALGAGECLALLVASASEGSPLIDMLAGHAAPEAGRILVDGHDIAALPPGRRRIGVISARDPLFGHLSVRRNVAFPLSVQRIGEPERGHRVHQILALLGLESQADKRPAVLSPAEAVRAALARALVTDPAAVLLDDPFGLLDPAPRRAMHQLLRRLARARGLTVLLVTRDREEALVMGERIGILDKTGLRQIGTATELLDRPADETVASGFGEANSLTGRVEWVEDDVAHVRLSAGPCMDAMAAPELEPGALCVVCVRPERIATAFISGGEDALGTDALAGTLSDIVHLGDHLRLRFRLAGGGELLVRRPASQPTTGLRPDRPALLAWQAAHAVAFPQEG
jgi:putative spermidine/putrescine transport system ATP-binding protein